MSPTFTFFTLAPITATLPAASWPGTNGYCDMPHSFAHMDKSEWQIPQY